ncbi:hypothetical protein VPH35_051460 [Triticum aestivum]
MFLDFFLDFYTLQVLVAHLSLKEKSGGASPGEWRPPPTETDARRPHGRCGRHLTADAPTPGWCSFRTVARRLSAPPPGLARPAYAASPSPAPLYPSSAYPTRPLLLGSLSCSTFPPRLLLTGDPSENLRCLASDLAVWWRPSSPAPRSGILIPEVFQLHI